jgi:aryl-alcohol dehydrogenase-like predicted oxidoreductase
MEYFQRALTPERLGRVESLAQYAESHGRRLLDLAISWLMSRSPVASVIAGATTPEQVRRNVLAATWRLSPEELDELNEIAPR